MAKYKINGQTCIEGLTETGCPTTASCPCNFIGDFVWFDEDGDGIQDPGEEGIEGLTVLLLDSNYNEIDRTETDQNGYYLFSCVPDGDYYVQFLNTDCALSFTQQYAGTNPLKDSNPDETSGITDKIHVENNRNNISIDAGLVVTPTTTTQCPCNVIGDYVWYDEDMDGIQDPEEEGIPGVLVTLTDLCGNVVDTVETDCNGRYLFSCLLSGCYYVQFELPPGYEFTLKDQGDDDTVDSDACPLNGIAGPVCLCDNIRLDLDAGMFKSSATSSSTASTTTVCPTTPCPCSTTVCPTTTTTVAPTTTTTVAPTTTTTVAPTTTTTVAPTTTTTVAPPTTTTIAPTTTTTIAPPTTTTAPCNAVGDFVWFDRNKNGIQDAGEPGIKDISVVLFDASGRIVDTAQTDANGRYFFNCVPNGSYYAVFELPDEYDGFTLQGNDAGTNNSKVNSAGKTNVFVLNGAIKTNLDAGLINEKGSISPVVDPSGCNIIGDYVWLDDGDGIQQDSEPGLAGITVNLYSNPFMEENLYATTKTDANGYYVFTCLPDDQYKVQVVFDPLKYKVAPQNQGNDPENNSKGDNTGLTPAIPVNGGDIVLNQDIGLVAITPTVVFTGGNPFPPSL